MLRALPLLLIFAIAGCPQKTQTPTTEPDHVDNTGGEGAPHELLATLERTQCYGWCPAYKVSVYRDGVVEYEGEQYVKTTGKATGHLSPDKVAELEKLFVDNGYMNLKDEYTNYEMTDMPSANTSFHQGAQAKTIAHYHGDSSAPAALSTVENGIDQIVEIDQWIGTDDERQNLSGR